MPEIKRTSDVDGFVEDELCDEAQQSTRNHRHAPGTPSSAREPIADNSECSHNTL